MRFFVDHLRWEFAGLIRHLADWIDPDVGLFLTRDEVIASLDRGLAQVAAGQTVEYDLDG